jgi:hypothetical protein
MVADWPTRSQAEQLRQWPLIVHAAEQVAKSQEFDGLLLIGSFAAGRADEVSDVDLVAVVRDGRFRQAWAQRRELETPGALLQWDLVIDGEGDTASHKWLTRGIVKVECTIVDAARGDMKLAEPYAVIAGDTSLASRFPPLASISPDVLEAYAQGLRDKGLIPEVETRYGELRDALRRARLPDGTQS